MALPNLGLAFFSCWLLLGFDYPPNKVAFAESMQVHLFIIFSSYPLLHGFFPDSNGLSLFLNVVKLNWMDC